VLGDDRGKPVQGVPTCGDGLQRGGEHAVGIAHRDPDADVAHVDTDPTPPTHVRTSRAGPERR
jgi:hypothetical protein